ncbi:MAG TPA: hypothetical protein VL332_04380 [Candidatus Saccharimonadaceae bacterium]|jgi:hypothetical protein|nr:hypothetical protein [Candidatus Saccharimonadaceae bacterium]
MRRVPSSFVAALALVAGLASLAHAQSCPGSWGNRLPSSTYSTWSPVLTASSSGTAINGGFTVVVRDQFNVPMVNAEVWLYFVDCAMVMYEQQNAGVGAECGQDGDGFDYIFGNTDASGSITFAARAGGHDNPGASAVTINVILRQGTALCSATTLTAVPSRSTDIDGDGDTDGCDYDLMVDNYLHHPDRRETDYNNDGTTALGDFAIFAAEYARHASGTLCFPKQNPCNKQ